MKEDPKALKLRDLPEWLMNMLRHLSRDGYIYIGRTGEGGIAALVPASGYYFTCEG